MVRVTARTGGTVGFTHEERARKSLFSLFFFEKLSFKIGADLKTAAAFKTLAGCVNEMSRLFVFLDDGRIRPDFPLAQGVENILPVDGEVLDEGKFAERLYVDFAVLCRIPEEGAACQTGHAVDNHGAGTAFALQAAAFPSNRLGPLAVDRVAVAVFIQLS